VKESSEENEDLALANLAEAREQTFDLRQL
jgi:hypothetical protein